MNNLGKKWLYVCLPMVWALPAAASEGFDPVLFTAKVVNSLIFFGGLFYVLRRPIGDFFTDRVSKIRTSMQLADESLADAKRRLDEIERKKANLDRELEEIQHQARAEAEREKERIQIHARKEAEQILVQAKAEVDNMQRDALRKLRSFVVDLAVKEAEAMVRDSITEEERKKLFVDFTERLGAES